MRHLPVLKNELVVYNYNRTSGLDYQVYYKNQAADAGFPQTVYGGAAPLGYPDANMTNGQCFAMHGVAYARRRYNPLYKRYDLSGD